MNVEEYLAWLRKLVDDKYKTRRAAAKAFGMVEQNLGATLNGVRPPSQRLLRATGHAAITVYVPIAKASKRG